MVKWAHRIARTDTLWALALATLWALALGALWALALATLRAAVSFVSSTHCIYILKYNIYIIFFIIKIIFKKALGTNVMAFGFN